MKRIFLSCIVTLISLLSIMSCNNSKYRYETFKNDQMQTKVYTLKNGLKVYMSVNKDEPRIQTAIAVKVGSKNDPSETTGLAHYFEHLMFKGTESFGTMNYEQEKPLLDTLEQLFEEYRVVTDPAERAARYAVIDSISYEASKIFIPNEYDKLMASIGADGSNAYTSQDMTVYLEDIPSNQVENWAKIQSDRFKHAIIRGFHTELETVYEEKNMSLTKDNRKVFEAIDAALFPHHPYGTQTVLGSQEHLKNPSITNIKNYYNKWYVPNNIAICIAGDFNPDNMIDVIEKYFGDMVPNENLEEQKLKIVEETPITEPIVKDVYGLESEYISLGWRFPGNNGKNNLDTLQMLSYILYNGVCGVMDQEIIQKQKALSAYGYVNLQPDYSSFIMAAYPKEGQTLEELRTLLLSQLDMIKSGNFSDTLIPATIRNIKKRNLSKIDGNNNRVNDMITSFIYGIPMQDMIDMVDRLSKITKNDIAEYASRHFANNYAQINKLKGEDKNVQKIEKPKITPILTNRDASSTFIKEIQESAKNVAPIEPVFVDFNKDMEIFKLDNGIEVLYKHNDRNDLFDFRILVDGGTNTNKYLSMAFDYFNYLGTDSLTQTQIDALQYNYATYFSTISASKRAGISVSGLNESFEPVFKLALDKINGVKADEEVLANLKLDAIKSLNDRKLNQKACFSTLAYYIEYGKDNPSTFKPTPKEISELTSEFLLNQVKNLFNNEQRILYYGPLSKDKLKEIINRDYKVNTPLKAVVEKKYPMIVTDKPKIFVVPYNAKQINMLQYSNKGDKYDNSKNAVIALYNSYFGGGMNAIVFQEMREARGLAYSAYAYYSEPLTLDDNYNITTFIATQNDKLHDAVNAFDNILNNMPESENAFDIAKEQIISTLRTTRITKSDILFEYLSAKDLNLSELPYRDLFNKVQTLTLEDVVKFQQDKIKGAIYHIGILGDKNDLNLKGFDSAKYGEIVYLSLEDIFGY